MRLTDNIVDRKPYRRVSLLQRLVRLHGIASILGMGALDSGARRPLDFKLACSPRDRSAPVRGGDICIWAEPGIRAALATWPLLRRRPATEAHAKERRVQ